MSVGATHLSFRRGEGEVQLDALLAALAERDGPRILLGDLNLGPEVVVPAVTAAGYTVAPTEATFPAGGPPARGDFRGGSGGGGGRATAPGGGAGGPPPRGGPFGVACGPGGGRVRRPPP